MKISNLALVAALAVSSITASHASFTEEAQDALLSANAAELATVATALPGDIEDQVTAIGTKLGVLNAGAGGAGAAAADFDTKMANFIDRLKAGVAAAADSTGAGENDIFNAQGAVAGAGNLEAILVALGY